MNTALLRTLIIYAVILPLAVLVGWMAVDLADWNRTSFAIFAAILFVLLLPVMIKWHYPVMVFSWSTYITIFFLPGQPGLWMVMVGITLGIAVLNRIIQKQGAFLPAPSITVTLLALLVVVVITAKLRGGFGVQALGGSSVGGKPYYYIIAGILGYFAFASQPIPPERAKLYAALFFLPGIVTVGSTLIYYAGPAFYFLFLIFPVGFAAVQALNEYGGGVSRIAGFTVAATSVGYFLLARYGAAGVLRKWWRLLLLLFLLALGAMGGYRSTLALFGLIFVVLFLAEGLLRSPMFPAMLLIGTLVAMVMVPFTDKLPPSMQRSLSFLPVKIDPAIRADAEGSIDWRVEIWQLMVPELPKYFWLGKGYAQDMTDIYLTQQAVRRNRASANAGAILSGDYHSGPLSVYIPFGVFGSLAFVAFLGVSIRALSLNYRYGRPELRMLNRFLFAYFTGRVIFFVVAFGSISGDLYLLTGTVGLSVALNRGICRKPVQAPKPVQFRGNLRLRATQPGVA